MYDLIIVGAGIVGLGTAYAIQKHHPHLRICLLEKETGPAVHQTGHNSGVIHSGLYYKPGSIKAQNCAAGRHQLEQFAREHNIPFDICGKILVATNERELPFLETIADRGRKNGLNGLVPLDPDTIREHEPHCQGLAGLYVPQTGIIDFSQVSRTLVDVLRGVGVDIFFSKSVFKIIHEEGGVTLHTNAESFQARHLITCGGLQCDRLAQEDGCNLDLRIVPFRGDYYELTEKAQHKVRHLIYPVPDPDLPFLGVHFTRMLDGCVECGPNAVFNFKRESYSKTGFSIRDTYSALSFPGTWRLFKREWKYGLDEYKRAFSKKAFLTALQKMIPDMTMDDISPGRAGVRAQALDRNGHLLDDFVIEHRLNSIHVLNAPSPAATAALAIGDTIRELAEKEFTFPSPP